MRSSFSATNKRSYGRVFNTRHVSDARLQNGERPKVPSPSPAYPRAAALEVESDNQAVPKVSSAAPLDMANGICAADVEAEDAEEEEAAEMDSTQAIGKMRYRRADGSQVTRGMGRMLQ
jgi:hypothetical protein